MKVASINLRKRANDPHTVAALQRWLAVVRPSILMTQEAVGHAAALPPTLAGMDLIAGNGQVACWSRREAALPTEVTTIPAVVVETESVLICGTYLSAYSSAARVRQLHNLRNLLLERDKSVLLIGDFNLAPMLTDGRYGDNASKWTSAGERAALAQLVNEIGLVDLTNCFRLGEQQFTFERINKGKWTRFRCDLAFAPDGPAFAARYDHGVRKGSYAFTDHSACIVDVARAQVAPKVPAAAPHAPTADAPGAVGCTLTARPYNTAIRRTGPSKPVRALIESGALGRWRVRSILDYGCGHGADVRHLAGLGYVVAGYDPHPDFGRAFPPSDRFDLVLLMYVLNVLPTQQDRLAALRGAAQYLSASGRMLVVARSASEIEREAAAKGWPRHSDGYLSNANRGMFQHGMTREELVGLTKEAALRPADEQGEAGGVGVNLLVTRPELTKHPSWYA